MRAVRCCRWPCSDTDGADIGARHRRAHRTPQPYLEQILLALKGAGLVRSKRGVGGGYVLARDPGILLSEIVSAVDGPIALGDFGEPHQDGACDHEGNACCIAVWNDAGEHMRQHLDSYTLAAVARMAQGEAPWPPQDPRTFLIPNRVTCEELGEVGGQGALEGEALAGGPGGRRTARRRGGTAG